LAPAWGLGTPLRPHGAWAMPSGGHTLLTRGAWALPLGWALPSTHVALGLCLRVGDEWRCCHGSGLKGNGLVVRTHDQ